MKNFLIVFALLLSFTSHGQRYFIRLGAKGVPVASSTVNRVAMPQDGNEWRDITDAVMGLEQQKPTSGTEWRPTDTWLDGTPMTDADTLTGWFEKRDGIYYERHWANGVIWLDELGLQRGTDERTDVLARWDRIVKYTPPGIPFNIRTHFGLYYSSKTLRLIDANWRIDFTGATFIVPGNQLGFLYGTSGPGGVDGAILEGISFVSQGQAEWDGVPGATYGMSKERPKTAKLYFELETKLWRDSTGKVIPAPAKTGKIEDYQYHGFMITAKCEVGHCYASNFSGCGFVNWGGDVGKGSNTSMSYFHDNRVSNVGLHGIIDIGPDANACTYTRNDIRNVKGVGLYGRSFLGGLFIGNMVHYADMDNFRGEGDAADNVFIGNYAEAYPYSRIGAHFSNRTLILGGTMSDQNIGGTGYESQTGWRIPGIGGIAIADQAIRFGRRDNDVNKAWKIINGGITENYDDRANRFNGGLSIVSSQFSRPQLTVVESSTTDNGKPVGADGIAVSEVVQIGNIRHFAMSPSDAIKTGIQLRKGDRFETEDEDYIVTKGGAKPEWKAR